MIYLGKFKAGTPVFFAANFHNDNGTLEDPTSPEAQRRAPDGVWTAVTAPSQQNSKTGHYGESINTIGFAEGQHVIRMAGMVSTSKTVATEFTFLIVGNTETEINTNVSSRLATSSYTAPDNAGIANVLAEVNTHPTLAEIEASTVLAKQAKLDFVEKWILNKLVESPIGTWTLFDDNDVPLKTWTWNSGTKTRSKAT